MSNQTTTPAADIKLVQRRPGAALNSVQSYELELEPGLVLVRDMPTPVERLGIESIVAALAS